MQYNTIIKITAVAITVVFMGYLLLQIQIGDVFQILLGIDPFLLILGFIFYVFSYFIRTLRFHYLFLREIPVKEIFPITCVHNMMNSILPAKTGEMSYIYLIKRIHNRPVGEGIATLFIARIFDIICISIIFFMSIIFINRKTSVPQEGITIAAIMFVVILILLYIFFQKPSYLSNLLSGISSQLSLDRTKIGSYILEKSFETVQSIERIKFLERNSLLKLSALSFGIWFCLYSSTYILVTAMNIHVDVFSFIFAATFAFVANVLPIQGIGSFGTLEAGWTIGFLAVGVPKELAISSGFSYHIIIMVFYLTLGLWASIVLKNKKIIF